MMDSSTKKDLERLVGTPSLEGLALVILIFAIIRIISYIGVGFDPHHDYYAFAPGLYVSEGLQPHKDFYTHYGAIDAVIKGALLNVFGKSLYVLRISLLLLSFIGLLSVCYCTNRTRYERIWLLLFIIIWAAFDPTSGSAEASSVWHHMAWSSDIAVFLIAILCVTSYWYLICDLTLPISQFKIASQIKTLGLKIKSNNFHQHLIILLGLFQGFLVSSIFFTKFTIGLSMIAATIMTNMLVVYLEISNNQRDEEFKDNKSGTSGTFRYVLIKTLKHMKIYIPILGFLVGVIYVLSLIGGTSYINNFFDDIFLSQYDYFSGGGSNFRLLKWLLRSIPTEFTAISLIVSVLILTRLQRLAFSVLLIAALIVAISSNALSIREILSGFTSSPDYVRLVHSCIASFTILGVFQLCPQLKIHKRELNPTIVYFSVVAPLGLFSLTQFYPLTDGFHAWWAVGSAIPLAAWIAAKLAKNYKLLWSIKAIAAILLFSWLFTILSFAIHANNLRKYNFEPVEKHQPNSGFLVNISTADHDSASLLNDAKDFVQKNPKTIILESGPGAFVNLVNSESSRKALAICRIKPLTKNPKGNYKEDYINYIRCLKSLKSQGWSVALTNNNVGKLTKVRMIRDTPVAGFAVLEPVDKFPLPEITKSYEQGKRHNKLWYWTLE